MSKERVFDLLVFDWDGTLFDSTGLIVQCIQDACLDLEVTPPDAKTAREVIGLELGIAIETAVPGLAVELYPKLVEHYRFHYFAKQDGVTLYEGTTAFLDQCRQQGYLLAIATGKARRGLDAALESIQLKRMFDLTRTADETASKPDPLMLNELMQILGVPAHRTLMIGDTTHDIQMAVNASVPSLAITHGAHPLELLSEYTIEQGLRGIVHSVKDMQQWMALNG